MTRFLSDSLQAKEPYFSRSLSGLEKANGHPSTDIHFTLQINAATKDKLRSLGLDPKETTPKELYMALQNKLARDDEALTKALRKLAAEKINAEADPVAGMIEAIKSSSQQLRCFGVKKSKLKSLLKVVSPKKTMKALGYRSVDSMLKREPTLAILPATNLFESLAWQKKFHELYRQLGPSDFEERMIYLYEPTNSHWKAISAQALSARGSNILANKETGAIVLMPLPKEELPKGVVTADMSLALNEVNQIRATSTFLKISQVRSGFGDTVYKLSNNQTQLKSRILDQPIPWNLVHRYYSQVADKFRHELFEPYLRAEDMVYTPIEESLKGLVEDFSFWDGSSFLGMLDGHSPVSLNLIDSALNLCNARSYEERISHYFKNSLWHELLLRYLNHEPVENSLINELQPELAESSQL
ncbi:MAG TPA: hypothetical protein VL989_02935 [Candidatus Sulfotelmatobacter sp.]|nr:hypothetical protein [Candidatus Sulfotelmatobacter sp.]